MAKIIGNSNNNTINGTNSDDTIIGDQETLNVLSTAALIPHFGNDVLNGQNGNDTIYGDLTTLNYKAIATLNSSKMLTIPASIIFGSDTINGGNGNDKLVGDVKDILISAQAGTATTADARAFVANLTLYMGADTITAGNGNDTLIGDVENMKLEAIGGTTSGPFADARIAQNSFTFGADSLTGKSGNDLLIGDISLLEISIKGGTATANGGNATAGVQPRDIFTQGNTFTFGKDTLTGGAGNDTLIGDVATMTIALQASTVLAGSLSGSTQFLNNVISFGSDSLNGGEGNDLLIGDVQSLTISLIGGNSNSISEFPDANIVSNTFTFGNDTINGGSGNDTIYGDLMTLNYKSIAGLNSSTMLTMPISILFGADTINGGSGNSRLVGDVKDILILAQAGTATTADARAFIANLNIQMGADTLIAGSGGDTLIGDVEHMKLEATGGTTSGPFADARIAQNSFTFGADSLTGKGGNDLLVGDIDLLEISVLGGKPTANGGNATSGIQPREEFTQGNTFTFGKDTLTGGAGNDTLIGDVTTMTILLKGNTVVPGGFSGNAQLFGSLFSFGLDSLNGGDGNDSLVGDVQSLSINLIAGNASGIIGVSNALFQDNTFTFGNDVMDGGSGNDQLVGDVQTMTIQLQGGTVSADGWAVSAYQTITNTFGNDTMNGGSGNDVLVGDVATMSFTAQAASIVSSNNFANADTAGNLFEFGNDTLDGSDGNDTLIGDVQALTLSFKGGVASSGNANSSSQFDVMNFGADTLKGGAGNDTLIGDIQTLSMIAQDGTAAPGAFAGGQIFGLTMTLKNNFLDGGAGNDVLIGSIQSVLFTLQDNDIFLPLVGNTLIFGNNTLLGGDGNDTLYANLVDPTQLDAFRVNNTVQGGTNILKGGSGNDSLYGGFGTSYLQGGAGNDTLNGNNENGAIGTAIADYSDATSGVTVDLAITTMQNVGGGLGQDTLISINSLIDSTYKDRLYGNAANNTFYMHGGSDTVDGRGGADLLTFIDITQPTAPIATYVIPTFYQSIYEGLQTSLGHPYWLPTAPTSFNINGILADNIAHTIKHGSDTMTFKNIEGIQGTNLNDAIIMDSTFLIDPNADPLGLGGPGYLISGEGGSDVLIGGSGDDVILGGRVHSSNEFTFISAGSGSDQIQIGFNLSEAGLANPTVNNPFGSISVDATPNTPEAVFNIVYAGSGDDTVWAYCSLQGGGLSLVDLGDGNDTFNDYCPLCEIMVFGGNGNDYFNIKCSENYKYVFGDDGNDTFDVAFLTLYDYLQGGRDTDLFLIAGATGGAIEGGAGADIFVNDVSQNPLGFSADMVTFSYASSAEGVHVDLTGIGSGGDAEGDDFTNWSISNPFGMGIATNTNIIGSAYDDVLKGDTTNNAFIGNGGHNTYLYDLMHYEGHDVIIDFDTTNDTLQLSSVISLEAANDQAIISDDGTGHVLITFFNGTSINLMNVDFVADQQLTDVVDNIVIDNSSSAADFASFMYIIEPSVMGIFDIPVFYQSTYADLQTRFGTPEWLPPAPTSFNIDGIRIDGSSHTATHGSDIVSIQGIEGIQGTNLNDYIVMDSTFLNDPNADPFGLDGPGYLLSGEYGSNVLVGGSGNDVIFGGRGGTSNDFTFISAGSGSDQIQIGENLSENILIDPTVNNPFGSIGYDATPNTQNAVFNIVYAGSGDDTVWAYCSLLGGGLSWVDLGDGNDTFNDYCPVCDIIVYGGNGNDYFKILCAENYKFIYGDAGNDIFDITALTTHDYLRGGEGADTFRIYGATAGTIEGGVDADSYIAYTSTNNVTISYASSTEGVHVDLTGTGSGGDAEGDDFTNWSISNPNGIGYAINTNLIGSTHDDVLKGDSTNNIFTGNGGHNTYLFSLSHNDGQDTIIDFDKVNDTLELHHVPSMTDVNTQAVVSDDGTGHVLISFATGTSINLTNVDFVVGQQLTDVVDNIVIVEDPDFASFMYISAPSAPMATFVIPAFYQSTYASLQAQFGNPAWLPAAPTSFDINGILVDGSSQTATHGSDVVSTQGLEGIQGTNLNDYIVMDSTFLTNPNADPLGLGGPGYLLSGDGGSDVLVGGSGNDVILGGRVQTSNEFAYISAGSGNDQIQIGFNLSEAGLANPTVNNPFGSISVDATPNTQETLFNIVYAGSGDDTVWAYCSLQGGGLSWVDLGDGNDTFNDYCPVCDIIVYGGNGNDYFKILCAENYKFIYGDAGNDIFDITSLTTHDYLRGGEGADIFKIYGATAGTIEGGVDADSYIAYNSTNNVTISYASSTVGVQVNLTTGVNSGGDAQGDNFTSWSATNTNLIGSTHNDVLKGDTTNNVFTGNGGLNTYLFDLGVNEGHDAITDFSKVNDTLQLHNVASIAAANAQAVISNDGSGHALATFANGTSINFANVGFVVGQHLTDIVNNITII